MVPGLGLSDATPRLDSRLCVLGRVYCHLAPCCVPFRRHSRGARGPGPPRSWSCCVDHIVEVLSRLFPCFFSVSRVLLSLPASREPSRQRGAEKLFTVFYLVSEQGVWGRHFENVKKSCSSSEFPLDSASIDAHALPASHLDRFQNVDFLSFPFPPLVLLIIV